MNSSLEFSLKLVKNLSDNNFKYLSEELNPKLKMTEIKLELISDIDKYFFCWKRIKRKKFLTSQRNLVNEITNTWKFMILKKKVNTS